MPSIEEIYLHSWFVPLSDTRQEEVYWDREEESAQWNRREKMKASWDKKTSKEKGKRELLELRTRGRTAGNCMQQSSAMPHPTPQ